MSLTCVVQEAHYNYYCHSVISIRMTVDLYPQSILPQHSFPCCDVLLSNTYAPSLEGHHVLYTSDVLLVIGMERALFHHPSLRETPSRSSGFRRLEEATAYLGLLNLWPTLC